jgi:uncharacterized cupredoxin-like copper-binding protein
LKISLILVVVVGVAFIFASASMLWFPIQPQLYSSTINQKPTINITIYAGEVGAARYGFGNKANNITSPGPTIYVKVSDVVNVTMVNVGNISHAFAVTDGLTPSSKTLFSAVIASASNPLPPGEKGTVIFQPASSGSFYYVCPVPGHAQLGMWGKIVIRTG